MSARRPNPIALLLALACPALATGSGSSPVAPDKLAQESCAIVRGTVQGNEGFRDPATGRILTRTVIQVAETWKGRAPALIEIIQPGGEVGQVASAGCFTTRFAPGEERLWFLQRGPGGQLHVSGGARGAVDLRRVTPSQLRELRRAAGRSRGHGEDVTDQAALALAPEAAAPVAFKGPAYSGGGSLSNFITDVTYGFGARALEPDAGLPIPYQIDAALLPAGISSNQALAAVQAAIKAWEGGSPVRFEFRGWTNFGQAADTFTARDGLLRIQMHNGYGVTFPNAELGDGGFNYSTYVVNAGTWGSGGMVNGLEFHQILNSFIILDHTNAILQNTNALAEVLCHEIGHTLGLDHTSVNPGEPTNSSLYQAIMYFAVHGDNRGAVINSVDRDSLCQSHSPSNSPPFVFNRYLDATTASTPPNLPGVNRLQFTAYDLQGGTNLVLGAEPTDLFGNFTIVSNQVRYWPTTNTTGARVDPAAFEYYDSIYVRAHDGTNASSYANVDVLSLSSDSTGAGGDGLPDFWMLAYFGSVNPNAGPLRGPNDDFDGDGFTNLEEYQMGYQEPVTGLLRGANPTDGASSQRILAVTPDSVTFQSKAWELYELEGSINLTNWQRVGLPVQPTGTNGVFAHKLGTNTPAWYFRVRRVP